LAGRARKGHKQEHERGCGSGADQHRAAAVTVPQGAPDWGKDRKAHTADRLVPACPLTDIRRVGHAHLLDIIGYQNKGGLEGEDREYL